MCGGPGGSVPSLRKLRVCVQYRPPSSKSGSSATHCAVSQARVLPVRVLMYVHTFQYLRRLSMDASHCRLSVAVPGLSPTTARPGVTRLKSAPATHDQGYTLVSPRHHAVSALEVQRKCAHPATPTAQKLYKSIIQNWNALLTPNGVQACTCTTRCKRPSFEQCSTSR